MDKNLVTYYDNNAAKLRRTVDKILMKTRMTFTRSPTRYL